MYRRIHRCTFFQIAAKSELWGISSLLVDGLVTAILSSAPLDRSAEQGAPSLPAGRFEAPRAGNGPPAADLPSTVLRNAALSVVRGLLEKPFGQFGLVLTLVMLEVLARFLAGVAGDQQRRIGR